MDRVRELASKKAAVIFTKSSCCMCYSIKTLFYELGASPAIHELDQDPYGRDMERALRALGCDPSVPAVFIGGRFVGSSKDVISLHVDGSLKQMLKDAKAIWFWYNEKLANLVPYCHNNKSNTLLKGALLFLEFLEYLCMRKKKQLMYYVHIKCLLVLSSIAIAYEKHINKIAD